MLNWLQIEARNHELTKAKQLNEAETFLLRCYEELKLTDQTEDLEYVIGALAHFYSMPETEDRGRAERFFLEREGLSGDLHSKLETATFYFYVLRDFSKTVEKVKEMGVVHGAHSSPSYYSALSLMGQALLELNRIEEADRILKEMYVMVQSDETHLPYGDEINFLEHASLHPALASKCRLVAVDILPRIRSKEYAKRAQRLLA
jgi:hypothetical protein